VSVFCSFYFYQMLIRFLIMLFNSSSEKWWRAMWGYDGKPCKKAGMNPVELWEVDSPTWTGSHFLNMNTKRNMNFLGQPDAFSSVDLLGALSWQTEGKCCQCRDDLERSRSQWALQEITPPIRPYVCTGLRASGCGQTQFLILSLPRIK